LFQNIIIIFLFWSFSKTIGFTEKLLIAVSVVAYSYVLFQDKHVNEQGWNMIQSSNIVFMVLSRVPQILTNFKNQSTGQLAFLTFFLSFAGSAARLLTVLYETNDFLF